MDRLARIRSSLSERAIHWKWPARTREGNPVPATRGSEGLEPAEERMASSRQSPSHPATILDSTKNASFSRLMSPFGTWLLSLRCTKFQRDGRYSGHRLGPGPDGLRR